MDGEAYTVQPEGVTANAVMLAAAGLDSAAALKALRDISPQGAVPPNHSSATAQSPAAPAGRADDFALHAQSAPLRTRRAYTVQPEGVTANAMMLTAAGLSSAAALKALRTSPQERRRKTLPARRGPGSTPGPRR